LAAFFFFATRCYGGLFATTLTARSKRCQASGSNSISFSFWGFFVMPPQPLSRVRPNAKVLPGAETLYTLRPNLAPLAMGVIAHWSEIEARTAAMLAFVLRAEAAPTMAMLQAIRSASAQIDMIEAAASSKLAGEQLEMFDAIIRLVRNAAKKRHPIAHHIWAFAMDMVDAALLIEPSAYLEMFVTLSTTETAQLLDIDNKRVMVYRERDFQEIIEEMKAVLSCIDRVTFILHGTKNLSPKTYEMLSAEPLFQEALKWTKKNRPRPAG
jgi:hypothetical protein